MSKNVVIPLLVKEYLFVIFMDFVTLPNNIVIKASTLHGLGLFATCSFKKDEIVFSGTRKTMQITEPSLPIGYVNGVPIIPSIHCPQIGQDTYHVYSFDSFMNHSAYPNTTITYINDTSYFHTATRDIAEDEELTVNYNEVYHEKYPDQHVEM